MGTDAEGNPNKFRLNEFGTAIPLYTASPKREWQDLTDEEAEQIIDEHWEDLLMLMEVIEAKLKEKNGG